MTSSQLGLAGIFVLAGTLVIACSSGLPSDKNDAGMGGTVATGGSAGSTAHTGGAVSSGGGSAAATTQGGSNSAGGLGSTAGTSSTGGSKTVGGTTSTVASSGGATNPGGSPNVGGTAAAGGTGGVATGGAMPNTGGAATGGAPSTGGASSTAPTCTIDSGSGPVTYTIGTANSANRCLVCNPNVSTTTWTPDAAACGCTGSLESLDSAGHCIGNFETLDSAGRLIAKMVTITAPSSIQNYSIDVTEVTKGQYDSWLATNPALPASTDANCGYVTSYAEQGTGYTGTDAGHHPVRYVDWCDAYAYCKGVGKRLCGAIGGGPVEYTAGYDDATQSQWYRACSSAGADTYPYSGTYQATYCNGSDYGAGQTVAVGSLANCVTSTSMTAGIYDLSGNVSEWEDSCSGTGPSAYCRVRGGSFSGGVLNDGAFLTCGYSNDECWGYYARNFSEGCPWTGYVGFRCCSP